MPIPLEVFGLSVWRILFEFLCRKGVKIAMTTDKTGYDQYPLEPGGVVPKWIIIHHSYSKDNTKRDWEGIKKYHMSYRHNGNIISEFEYMQLKKEGKKGLEWPAVDIAYNFGIEDVDNRLIIRVGRRIGVVGAHAQGFNARSIGICVIGSYDTISPDEPRLKITLSLTRDLQIAFKIPGSNVLGHRETFGMPGAPPGPSPKSCPGKLFDMVAFRERCRP